MPLLCGPVYVPTYARVSLERSVPAAVALTSAARAAPTNDQRNANAPIEMQNLFMDRLNEVDFRTETTIASQANHVADANPGRTRVKRVAIAAAARRVRGTH